MTHSIPDNSGLIIHTPIGRVVHTGRLQAGLSTPPTVKPVTYTRLPKRVEDGVLALISDSTRAESGPATARAERDIMGAIEEIVKRI